VESHRSDEQMQKEIQKLAFCKHFGLPYKGPAMAVDANGEQKLSPEACAWMLQRAKDLPKLSPEESADAGARALEMDVAHRRSERSIAGPNEKRTPLQEALDRLIDEKRRSSCNRSERRLRDSSERYQQYYTTTPTNRPCSD